MYDPHHRLERRELSQQQDAKRVQQYVERCYERLRLPHSKPEDAWRREAWAQWNGVPRDDQAAREVEPRRPTTASRGGGPRARITSTVRPSNPSSGGKLPSRLPGIGRANSGHRPGQLGT